LARLFISPSWPKWLRLARTRIGTLRDPHLAPGTWRALAAGEVRALYAAALSGIEKASE